VTERAPTIGVLALQGAFREHAATLRRLGADVREVRLPDDLDGLDGLVVPGGESTTIMKLAELYGLDDAIRGFRGAVLGTCAGMIVLDREHLGLADLVVDRNAYGRQVASFEAELALDGEPVLVRDGRFLLASFHPELTDDTRVHELFIEMVREESGVRA
jgi:5'-phosphate synthase pdxT subunit